MIKGYKPKHVIHNLLDILYSNGCLSISVTSCIVVFGFISLLLLSVAWIIHRNAAVSTFSVHFSALIKFSGFSISFFSLLARFCQFYSQSKEPELRQHRPAPQRPHQVWSLHPKLPAGSGLGPRGAGAEPLPLLSWTVLRGALVSHPPFTLWAYWRV